MKPKKIPNIDKRQLHLHGCNSSCRCYKGPRSLGIKSSARKRDLEVEDVKETHGTSTLTLSCIDYRFIEGVNEIMREQEKVPYYDAFVLAGASLGYNQTIYPDWPQTLRDHITLAKQLHHISRIVVIEHMDCGMYKAVYPEMTPTNEKEYHILMMHLLGQKCFCPLK